MRREAIAPRSTVGVERLNLGGHPIVERPDIATRRHIERKLHCTVYQVKMADNAEKMESKPNGFEGPTSPSSTYRTMDLILRVVSVIVSLAVLVLGGVSTAQSGVFLIGILGAPV